MADAVEDGVNAAVKRDAVIAREKEEIEDKCASMRKIE